LQYKLKQFNKNWLIGLPSAAAFGRSF